MLLLTGEAALGKAKKRNMEAICGQGLGPEFCVK
jgi:hypothetical protein